MRTVSFSKVLNGVLTRMGLDPTAISDAATKAAVALYVTERHREAWETNDWPETRMVEERVYRLRWDDLEATDIALGQIVYHEGFYWEALILNPATEPAEDAAEWELADDFERYVGLDQTGLTPISEVIAVWDSNPRLARRPDEVEFELTENGAQMDNDAPNEVWVEFSLRTSEFSATAYDAATAYAVDDVVLSGNECWKAAAASTGSTPVTGNANWTFQPLLHVLSRFVERAAYSDTLAEDGQQAKADRELARAYQALDDEFYKRANKQGQVKGYTVKTG